MKWFFLIFVALAPLLTSCDPLDEGCSTDSECRYGRTCQQGFCVGEVDLQANNNGNNNANNSSNNGTNNSNNGSNNYWTNNGYSNNWYTNNGYSNNNWTNNWTNNGTTSNFCVQDNECGYGFCVDNQCIYGCGSNQECGRREACTNRNRQFLQCVPADTCFLESFDAEPDEFCFANFFCEDREAFYDWQCSFVGEDFLFCNCSSSDGNFAEFEVNADACYDLARIEDLMNRHCGSRLRNTEQIQIGIGY